MGHELTNGSSAGAMVCKLPLYPCLFCCDLHHGPQRVFSHRLSLEPAFRRQGPFKIYTQIKRGLWLTHVIGPMTFVFFVQIKGASFRVPAIGPRFWVKGAGVPQSLTSFRRPLIEF